METSSLTSVFYKLSTVDGSSASFTKRKSLFWGYGLSKPSQENVHTHHHTLDIPYNTNFLGDRKLKVSCWQNINYEMLKMLNVKYILSHKLIPASSNYNLISKSNHSINLPNLYLYELSNPWDRIYKPSTISISHHNYCELQFYNRLLYNNLHEVSIAFDDFKLIDKSYIDIIKNYKNSRNSVEYTILSDTPDGYVLKTKGEGFIVLNYCSDSFNVKCGAEIEHVIPVNGIHSMFYIKKENNIYTIKFT